MRKTKSIAAIAMAIVLTTSMLATPAYAATNTTTTTSSSSSSSSVNKMPRKIYMTHYLSDMGLRYERASASIEAAEGLLDTLKVDSLGLPTPSFSGINLVFRETSYDYLIKTNAEGDATVLTFNSKANLDGAMKKIIAEEQAVMNAALKPYINYIDGIISNGGYTTAYEGDSAEVKAAKLSNLVILRAIKSTLEYDYTEASLFAGDVTGDSKTYQIGYISEASVGESMTQTVVSNDEEFTNFPRLILDGEIVDWGNVHHLDIFNNSNNSWWFAVKDGHTLNNDFYWLKGMMIPDFNDTISFDAYAGTEWLQYGDIVNSNTNSNDDSYVNDDSDTNGGSGSGTNGDSSSGTGNTAFYYYYNADYNYSSNYVYVVKDDKGDIYYYPNMEYIKAAQSYGFKYTVQGTMASSYSDYTTYFCFIDGKYYPTPMYSPYPVHTVAVSSTKADNTVYYISNGKVYGTNGTSYGTLSSRGYSKNKTWFCVDDGKFYSSAQYGKNGYFVSDTNSDNVATDDPYYEYWTIRLQALQDEIEALKKQQEEAEKNNNKTSSTNKNNSSSSDSSVQKSEGSLIIKKATLAEIKADNVTKKYKTSIGVLWTIEGRNIFNPADTNLNVTYNTKNIPTALMKAMKEKTDVSSAHQITVGENVEWGMMASMRVKFKENKAGKQASLYRFDSKTGSLILVSKSIVGNDGRVTFNNMTHGGDYCITLS